MKRKIYDQLVEWKKSSKGKMPAEIYERILHGKLEVNLGYVMENIVVQMLRASGHKLYYYSSYSKTEAAERIEVDFLIRKPNLTNRHNIYPIEVKSTTRYTLSSLEKFGKKYVEQLAQSIVLHTKDLEIKDGITYLPLYMGGVL